MNNNKIEVICDITKCARSEAESALMASNGNIDLAVDIIINDCGNPVSTGKSSSGNAPISVSKVPRRIQLVKSNFQLDMETEDKEYLTLKVTRMFPSSRENAEIHFRVKQTTQLGKLKKAYCEKIGAPIQESRFVFEGTRINDDSTPAQFEMKSGDLIEVYYESDIMCAGPSIEVFGLQSEDPLQSPPRSNIANQKRGNNCFEESTFKSKRLKTNFEISLDTTEEKAKLDEELEQLKIKHEDLVKKLRDKVECPVCLEVPRRAPVPICPNGHVVCLKCVREFCPTCRVRMENCTSTLAVTVIENIEHLCDHDGCGLKFLLKDLPSHLRSCIHRPVKCPGLDCSVKTPYSTLHDHVISCCVERAEIKTYKLPHEFTYMMNEDIKDLDRERENLNWKLEGVRYDDRIFFLKVTRKARVGRWFFFVHMIGSLEDTLRYGVSFTIFRPSNDGPEGKYAQKYSGDVCAIDIETVDEVEDKGLCLSLSDGGMSNFFRKNLDSGENEFSVSLNIFKARD